MNLFTTLIFIMCFCAAFTAMVRAEESVALRDSVPFRVRGGLPNVLQKLQTGGEVRIAFLGGSITGQEGWRPLTLAWFRAQFPAAQIVEINAAVGGTGSDLGVFRVQHDALALAPDLLFVEFAVNDTMRAPRDIRRGMEGIVRKTWRANPETDICFVYTLVQGTLADLQAGKYQRSASTMEEVADHYSIPSIHMGYHVARLEQEDKLAFTAAMPETEAQRAALGDRILFSPDGVHPYPDTGHPLYRDAIVAAIEEMQKAARLGAASPSISEPSKLEGEAAPSRLNSTNRLPTPHLLIPPLVPDNWEHATVIPLSHISLSPGWRRLDPSQSHIAADFNKRMPELWKTGKPGETLSFSFKGTRAAIYFLLGPDAGRVAVTLDGKTRTESLFDGYCSYHRLGTLDVGTDLEDLVHTVRVELLAESLDKAAILLPDHVQDFKDHPEKYAGSAFYAGAVLLIGDLQKSKE